jgi:hypothetical protein
MLLRQQFNFIGFARADKQGGIGRSALAGDGCHRGQARCLRQQTQLV